MENISIVGLSCVGCKSCQQSCPKRCISMKENEEGFWYPVVDEQSCIECRMCLNNCPVENTDIHRNEPKNVWAWRNKRYADIMRSASGGASDTASKAVLKMGGVVYGAAYDEHLTVRHIEITDDSEREKIQSSKYVQSDLGDSYSKVKGQLLTGRPVLFTGTPCQVAGLYSFLGEEYEKLFTMDLICHGVPSPKFFRKYLEYQNRLMGESIDCINFRFKEKRGWGLHIKVETMNKAREKKFSLDRYGKHYLDGDSYRECCYQCAYSNVNRMGDLTVGDFWGIEKNHPGFYSSNGVSCLLVNTAKGQYLFEAMCPYAEMEEATLEEGMEKQWNLRQPSVRPKSRDNFYTNIDNNGFIKGLKTGIQPKERIKSIIPSRLIHKIKSI